MRSRPTNRQVMMAEVSNQAKHMSRTVTDLITLARDGGANLMIRSSEASLADIIASALARGPGGPLTSDVDDHLLRVDADRSRSGRRAPPLERPQVRRRTSIHLRAGCRAERSPIEVHDDGPGIPPSTSPRSGTSSTGGPAPRLDEPGLGIGLAIVRAVAAAHGGTAEYRRSELLGGACFSITIPANARTGAPWIRELTAR
jgi:signal transduction histidine kinase